MLPKLKNCSKGYLYLESNKIYATNVELHNLNSKENEGMTSTTALIGGS